MTTDPLLQLLLDTHRGRDDAARQAWTTFAPRLIAFARAIVGRDDAEDVVQSVFLQVLRLDRRTISAVRDTHAWLAMMTRRTALNHIRALRREGARRAAHRPDRSPRAPGDDALAGALESLPRQWREVVVLKHVSGLTFDQISEALALNRNTAASRYRSALEALRRRLETAEADAEAPESEVIHAR